MGSPGAGTTWVPGCYIRIVTHCSTLGTSGRRGRAAPGTVGLGISLRSVSGHWLGPLRGRNGGAVSCQWGAGPAVQSQPIFNQPYLPVVLSVPGIGTLLAQSSWFSGGKYQYNQCERYPGRRHIRAVSSDRGQCGVGGGGGNLTQTQGIREAFL